MPISSSDISRGDVSKYNPIISSSNCMSFSTRSRSIAKSTTGRGDLLRAVKLWQRLIRVLRYRWRIAAELFYPRIGKSGLGQGSETFNRSQQFLGIDWLRNITIHARGQAAFAIPLHRAGGHRHDGANADRWFFLIRGLLP